MLRITFLGTGGTLPTPNRNPSGIMVNRKGELILFDCGEGTQQQMMRAKTGMNISSIFITHYHTDHFLGIIGLIQTMSFIGRKEKLDIYGPLWTKEFGKVINLFGYHGFEINVHELKDGNIIEKEDYSIKAISTQHSVPSLGYILEEKPRLGRFNREKAIKLGVPVGPLFSKLHKGEAITINGKLILPSQVVGPKRRGRKIAYSGDTRPSDSFEKEVENSDLLIHEGTFADDLKDKAIETKHTTSGEAAVIAKNANVKQLILTHISSRYSETTEKLLMDAKQVFYNVKIARDFMEIEVPYPDD